MDACGLGPVRPGVVAGVAGLGPCAASREVVDSDAGIRAAEEARAAGAGTQGSCHAGVGAAAPDSQARGHWVRSAA